MRLAATRRLNSIRSPSPAVSWANERTAMGAAASTPSAARTNSRRATCAFEAIALSWRGALLGPVHHWASGHPAHHASNGFSTGTPRPSTSGTLRVMRVMSCTRGRRGQKPVDDGNRATGAQAAPGVGDTAVNREDAVGIEEEHPISASDLNIATEVTRPIEVEVHRTRGEQLLETARPRGTQTVAQQRTCGGVAVRIAQRGGYRANELDVVAAHLDLATDPPASLQRSR